MNHKDFRELLARAEAGAAQAQYDLGLLCRAAETEVPDYAGAVSWFRLAALQSHALAQYELGRLYEAGAGIGRDIALVPPCRGSGAARGARASARVLCRAR